MYLNFIYHPRSLSMSLRPTLLFPFLFTLITACLSPVVLAEITYDLKTGMITDSTDTSNNGPVAKFYKTEELLSQIITRLVNIRTDLLEESKKKLKENRHKQQQLQEKIKEYDRTHRKFIQTRITDYFKSTKSSKGQRTASSSSSNALSSSSSYGCSSSSSTSSTSAMVYAMEVNTNLKSLDAQDAITTQRPYDFHQMAESLGIIENGDDPLKHLRSSSSNSSRTLDINSCSGHWVSVYYGGQAPTKDEIMKLQLSLLYEYEPVEQQNEHQPPTKKEIMEDKLITLRYEEQELQRNLNSHLDAYNENNIMAFIEKEKKALEIKKQILINILREMNRTKGQHINIKVETNSLNQTKISKLNIDYYQFNFAPIENINLNELINYFQLNEYNYGDNFDGGPIKNESRGYYQNSHSEDTNLDYLFAITKNKQVKYFHEIIAAYKKQLEANAMHSSSSSSSSSSSFSSSSISTSSMDTTMTSATN